MAQASVECGIGFGLRCEKISSLPDRPHRSSQVTLQNADVKVRRQFGKALSAANLHLCKIFEELGEKLIANSCFDFWATHIRGPIELEPEFPLADTALVHRFRIPQGPVEKCKMFDVPSEEPSAILGGGLVESIKHDGRVEGRSSLGVPRKLHLSAEDERASPNVSPCVDAEVLTFLTSTAKSLYCGRAEWEVFMFLKETVGPFRNFRAKCNFVYP